MHEYYQKNRSKLQKVMNRFLTLIAPKHCASGVLEHLRARHAGALSLHRR